MMCGALAKVAVMAGDVRAAVGHAARGRDAEVGVAVGLVAGQVVDALGHVDPVVTGMEDVISPNSVLSTFS